MDESEFNREYPSLSAVLPSGLISRCSDDHPLKVSINEDRGSALELWSKLVENTPAKSLIKTYENNLHLSGKFDAFVTELWCYQALSKWLCEDPKVLDLPTNQGMPDFACDDFDVDATLLQEADEEYRIRRKLEEIMGDRAYIGIQSLKQEFDVQATTGKRWSENENAVDEFINLIEEKLNPDKPETIETDAIRVEFKEKEEGAFGWVGRWDRARKLEPDDEEKIPERLRTKANQPRKGRPLVVFMDCKHTSIDFANEVRDILIGMPHSFGIRENVEVSSKIESASEQWDEYLIEIDAVPDPDDEREVARMREDDSGDTVYRGFPAIRPGEEGVFQEKELDQIAGVMLRMKDGEVCYIPNVFTSVVDAKSIYDLLSWGLETHKLTHKDLV